ncbi:MAG: hypothetical protein A3H88_02280 [Candidatus Blackburnbacteria bacterium RIFCSPLOWO2_02_FULL_44_9]|nr:MAG: hypothetical protein A3H88_02280 [Candidatus Blackburnbacteria bacterium RIFCSPLOWO2_02_FULL_44_9]
MAELPTTHEKTVRQEFVNTLEARASIMRLEESVRQITPEEILSPDFAESAREQFVSAMDFIAQSILETSEETGMNPKEIYFGFILSPRDFTRGLLTPPLPNLERYLEEGEELDMDIRVADEHDWWKVMSREQKIAISQVVGLDLTLIDEFKPPEGQKEEDILILQAAEMVVSPASENMPETRFYPAIVWHEGEVGITCIPVRPEV